MASKEVSRVRYFVAKCANTTALKSCISSGIWACRDRTNSTEHPRFILSQAFHEGKVIFLFSVNNCHGWHGYCELIDKPGCYEPTEKETKEQPNLGESGEVILWHHFRVSWKCSFLSEFGEQCVPFSSTDFQLSDNTCVNMSRNWQELPSDIGETMCRLVDKLHEDLMLKRQRKEDEKLASLPPPFLKSDILDSDGVREYWRSIVEKVECELGKIHLACPFGSQRYNLDGPNSDIDVFIVYQAHTRALLSFKPPKQTIKNRDVEKCDYTILELHRYCELLCGGDPRCVETLYLHDSTIIHSSPKWRQLTQLAPHTLTRPCLDKYLRDAQGSNGVKQFKRWRDENPGQTELPAKINKLCYIIIRLLQNARDVVKKGPIKVFRSEESEEKAILMSIREGRLSAVQVWDIIQRLQEEIENGKDDVATEDPSTAVEAWMLEQRFLDFSDNPPS